MHILEDGIMKTRFPIVLLVLLAAVAFFSLGCYPETRDDVSEMDIVATQYDENVDFGVYLTYAMEDTIYDLAELDDPTYPSDLDRTFQDMIIALVKSEMAEVGYQLLPEDSTEEPDLRIGLGAVTVEGSLYYTWGGYYGYYGYYGRVDYTIGTLMIMMADWATQDEDEGTVDVIWTAGIDGVLEDSTSRMSDRINRAIPQAFTQSPYLGANVEGKVQP